MQIAGIDGYKGGWIAVIPNQDNFAQARVESNEDLETLIEHHAIDFAIVDIPIGLTPGPEPRNTDQAMRDYLVGKTSCVFPTPARQALDAEDYWDASDINFRILGNKLPKQTFYIMPKIRHADRVVQKLGQDKIREGHPEVSFKILSGGQILGKKREPDGEQQRFELLQNAGFDVAKLKEQLRAHRPAQIDDLFDAAVLAWSASRWIKKEHRLFPPEPKKDTEGLEMVVYA